MIKELIKDRIYKSVSPLFEDIDFDSNHIDLDLTKNPMHGDFATNLALKFAKKISLKPMDLGNKISILLKNQNSDIFASVECINPGFINCQYSMIAYQISLLNANIMDLDQRKTKRFWLSLFPRIQQVFCI